LKLFQKFNEFQNVNCTNKTKFEVFQFFINLWINLLKSIYFIHEENLNWTDFIFSNDILDIYPSYVWLFNDNSLNSILSIVLNYIKVTSPDFVNDATVSSGIMEISSYILCGYQIYYRIFYSNIDQNKSWQYIKKDLIGKLISINNEKALELAMLYGDSYNIGKICHKFKFYKELVNYMKQVNQRTFTLYILKLFLVLDGEAVKSKEFSFEFFNIFIEFESELEEIVKYSQKLQVYYAVYKKSINLNEEKHQIYLDQVNTKINNKNNKNTIYTLLKVYNYQNQKVKGYDQNELQSNIDNMEIDNETDNITLLLNNYNQLIILLNNKFMPNRNNTSFQDLIMQMLESKKGFTGKIPLNIISIINHY